MLYLSVKKDVRLNCRSFFFAGSIQERCLGSAVKDLFNPAIRLVLGVKSGYSNTVVSIKITESVQRGAMSAF